KSLPDHIGEIRRAMIKHIYPDARVMRASNKCITRSEAGSDNAQISVALLLQPIETSTCVNHSLPGSVNGPANVRRDGEVRTSQIRWHAGIVVGQAQAQRADAKPL